MKGVVFDVVHDIVCEQYSITTWDRILLDAGVDGAYSSLGNYADSELDAIVTAASALLQTPPDDVLRWLGQHAFARLAALIPDTLRPIATWPELLESLDRLVHAEVTRVYPDAMVPAFAATHHGDGAMLLRYDSPRQLCAFAGGLIEGAGRWYGTHLQVRHLECTHRGDTRCLIEVAEQP